MNTKVVTAALLGTIAGLIGGFLLANTLNRSEINALKARADQQVTSNPNSNSAPGSLEISKDEIKAKIAEADANAGDLSYQKSLGIALYRYGTMKRDAETVAEAARLLERAAALAPKDYDVIVALGNAYFDIGYFNKDSSHLKKAREVYARALAQKPEDADVLTDLALSYYLDEPAELARSVEEFQKAIKINPKHERALQYLTETYMRQGNFEEAGRTLDKLKAVNPKSTAVTELATQIESKQTPTVK